MVRAVRMTVIFLYALCGPGKFRIELDGVDYKKRGCNSFYRLGWVGFFKVHKQTSIWSL